jgi:hypothetical protein
MKLQDDLAAVLVEGLPSSIRVIDYPAGIDAIQCPTVACWALDLTPAKAAPKGRYEVEFTLMLYTAYQDPERAEDDLAASLESLLDVLWDSERYLLTRATRTVSEDNKIHSWSLTVSGGITITEE